MTQKHKARQRDEPVICGHCGRTVRRRSRQQLYCGRRCRVSAHRAKTVVQRAKMGPRYPTSRSETDPQKKNKKFSALQRAKMESSRRIIGPRPVLDIEVWDRTWEPTVNSDGAAVDVSRIRARPLVEGRS
jgi:hypothetical protein